MTNFLPGIKALATRALAARALAACSLLLLALCSASAAPRIQVVGGEMIDLGRGRPGRVVRQLAITNVGSDTLRILSVGSGCGCLVGEPDRTALGPGDTARVQVTVETSGQVVEQWRKALSITTNDPHRPIVDVTVRASFRHDLRLLSLINTVARDTCPQECVWMIELQNSGDTLLTIQPPLAEEMRGLDVRFDLKAPRTLVPGDTLRIESRIRILGGEEFPSARVLITSSSEFDAETYVAWFYAPQSR